jgi:hypothetical protein
VAVTGTAVYVGGHQRWMNNSFAGDRAGPGAVAREGIAALGPVNGLPLPWNPGRDRGVGVFALVATAQGLWTGSDTERIGRYERHARSAFDGTTAGPATPIALNGLTSTQFPVSGISGMFFWNGRLYYTLNGGDTRLYYRWFTPESGTLGADTFVASGATDGRDWSTVNGLAMASGRLLYATTTGTLSTVDFSGGLPTGTPTTVGGPTLDGQSWQSRALFVLNSPD